MDLHNTKELFLTRAGGLVWVEPVLVHTALQQNTARTQQSSNSLEEAAGHAYTLVSPGSEEWAGGQSGLQIITLSQNKQKNNYKEI